jgi:hypothetical protein
MIPDLAPHLRKTGEISSLEVGSERTRNLELRMQMVKMPIEVTSFQLTRGAVVFLTHAQGLLSDQATQAYPGDPFAESLETGAARMSAVLRLAAGDVSGLTPAEGEALADALRVAADLALAARLDPRWESLGLPGDPVRELRELRDSVLRLVIAGHVARSLAA